MTVLTKTTASGKKPDVTLVPLVPERKIRRHQPQQLLMSSPVVVRFFRSNNAAAMCGLITTALVIFTGIMAGLAVYEQYFNQPKTIHLHATCYMSPSDNVDFVVLSEKPHHKVATTSTGSPPATGMEYFNMLFEELAIDEHLATVVIHNPAEPYDIMHDFKHNLTVIKAEERCFFMNIMPDIVSVPQEFRELLPLDEARNASRVRRVETALRAELPALQYWAAPLRPVPCGPPARPLPAYRLALQPLQPLQPRPKRSVSALVYMQKIAHANDSNEIPAPSAKEPVEEYSDKFLHYAGKHLQTIKVTNMADVIEYERVNNITKPTIAPNNTLDD